MRRNISNVLCVIGALFESTLAPRRSIAFRNSAGTWSRAPGKQFGVLGRWRDRHTRPARWSDTLRIRPVRWRKWNRIRIDLARLADPICRKLNSPISPWKRIPRLTLDSSNSHKKSRDYVYGIWQYNYLVQEVYFRGISCERENNWQSLSVMYKNKYQSRIPLYSIKLTHQLSFRNLNLTIEHHTRGK